MTVWWIAAASPPYSQTSSVRFGAPSRGLPLPSTPWHAAHDQRVSPTYVPDLVHASLDLLIDGESGVWHVANRGQATWAELACEAARRAGLDASLVRAVPTASLGLAAARPRFAVLGSERDVTMPSLDEALEQYVRETGSRAAPG